LYKKNIELKEFKDNIVVKRYAWKKTVGGAWQQW